MARVIQLHFAMMKVDRGPSWSLDAVGAGLKALTAMVSGQLARDAARSIRGLANREIISGSMLIYTA
jgi:hypothetical protein